MDNMSEEQVARLSEEQRREKRKERILKGSQKRMAAILSMDGKVLFILTYLFFRSLGGKRQAPCVEGMGSASSSNNAPEAPQPSLIKRTPSQPKTEKLLDFEKDDTGAPYKTENIIPVPPKYMEFVDKQRFWIAFLIGKRLEIGQIFVYFDLGLLSANLTLFLDHVGNLIVPVLVLLFSYEAFVFKTVNIFCKFSAVLICV